MNQQTVTADEVRRHTILRSDWVPCKAAFIDCRTPGSDQKDNYSFIGAGGLAGQVLDPNGCLAPAAVLATATEDD